ncbi:chymotrypsin-like serine proteinase [Aplysia californica]|uniref:Chymotrypsin-like serine proteinase n=1 Tax=Aplysia californica TaxID=6500 RepID=A0ABM1AAI2_APLCA|nr:chymotrypsin-like serine proteinase [Aplysia californica]
MELTEANFRIITRFRCLLQFTLATGFLVNTRDLCFVNSDANTCFRDSGGPLVCNGRLAGILSWPNFLCANARPTTASRVSFYTDWITSRL